MSNKQTNDRNYYHQKIKTNPEKLAKIKERRKVYRLRLKQQVMDAYSSGFGCCEHCGTTNLRVLTVDHVNNDGAGHRREIGRDGIYEYLKRNNYPNDPPLQVLCMNCQWIKRSSSPEDYQPRKVLEVKALKLSKVKHRKNCYRKRIKGRTVYFSGTLEQATAKLAEYLTNLDS